jgi:NADPH:quinone reductase-like Zn-dependent oxidoreductase
MPTSMRAATIDRFGGVDELRIEEVAVPDLGPNEVLVRVEYAGVGAWDPGEREGRYSELFRQLHGVEPSFPYVIGFDGAGTVVAVGDAVSGFNTGDRVYADRHLNPKGGFYAEFAVVEAPYVHPIPSGLSMQEAGAMPVDAITALLGLTDVLGLVSGESLLVFGASGGLGHLALQLAKRLGARVFAVASGQDGVAFAQRLGADAAIDGRTADVLAAAADFAADGIDAALLTAGGEAAQSALGALRDGGRAAYPRGIDSEPTQQAGFVLERYIGDNPPVSRSDQLGNLISAARFEVHVAHTFPLDRAADAHRALGEHHLGKLALQIR